MKARRFANLVLLGASLLCVAAGLMALGTARAYNADSLHRAMFVGGPLLLATGLLVCLRLPVDFRVGLAMTLLSLVVAAYGAEIYLRQLPTIRIRQAARRFGVPYDGRTRAEVVRDLRAKGKDAWPAMFPAWQGFPHQDGTLLPLGGIANVTTVFCNEMGQYVVYASDEHGFHNPPGIWTSRDIEVAVLGDSFAQGDCVPSDQNFTALIRREYPGTLNLGMRGNGPLLMLAGLKEFLVELRPGIVIWVYTEGNDLVSDLDHEKRDPVLTDYLRAGYRQGLLGRQNEIDAFLRGVADREYVARRSSLQEFRLQRFLRLWSVRDVLGLQLEASTSISEHPDTSLFRRILEEAQRTTRGWGGELYFVYLPSEARYFENKLRHGYDPSRREVLSIVEDLKIPLVDLDGPISGSPDIPELYAFRGGHFSPAGNRLVADSILKALHSHAGS
jgi:hypothetical protein